MTGIRLSSYVGSGLLAGGLILFLFVELTSAPYAGASGGGLAGLGAGLAILAAMVAMGIGGLILAVTGLIWIFKRRGNTDQNAD